MTSFGYNLLGFGGGEAPASLLYDFVVMAGIKLEGTLDDGASWDGLITNPLSDGRELVVGDGVILALGNNSAYSRSTDGGGTWGDIIDSGDTINFNGGAFGNGVFVLGGTASIGGASAIKRSTDNGIDFGSLITQPFGTLTAINSIAFGNNVFIAVSSGGKIARSTDDGETWGSLITDPFGSSNIDTIAFGNNTFVACATGGKIARSTDDGVSWGSLITNPFNINTNATIGGVAFGNNVFVAVSGDPFESDVNAQIIRSTDNGATWGSLITNPFGFTTIEGAGVAFGNGAFVAAARSGKIARSTDDGVTWGSLISNGLGTSNTTGLVFVG